MFASLYEDPKVPIDYPKLKAGISAALNFDGELHWLLDTVAGVARGTSHPLFLLGGTTSAFHRAYCRSTSVDSISEPDVSELGHAPSASMSESIRIPALREGSVYITHLRVKSSGCFVTLDCKAAGSMELPMRCLVFGYIRQNGPEEILELRLLAPVRGIIAGKDLIRFEVRHQLRTLYWQRLCT